jgi:hypothetical protein
MNREEAERAARIDRHSNGKRWVRNPDRETQGGFCLPKSPGRFFPDFMFPIHLLSVHLSAKGPEAALRGEIEAGKS